MQCSTVIKCIKAPPNTKMPKKKKKKMWCNCHVQRINYSVAGGRDEKDELSFMPRGIASCRTEIESESASNSGRLNGIGSLLVV